MKELLEKLSNGETTVDEVLQAIEDADKDKVPRSRLNDKIEEIKDLSGQLKDRDKQLKDLSGKAAGNEDLQQQIEKLQEENKQTAKDYQAKLEKQAFDFALEKAVTDAKAKNPKAVKALLDVENIKLDGDKLLGLEEQLKGLQESESYLFGTEEPKSLKGREPVHNDGKADGLTREQFASIVYGDRVQLYNEKPDLYKKLSE